MQHFAKIVGLIVALAASSAQAVPTLYFFGGIGFDANAQRLSVSSNLIQTQDIFPAPNLSGRVNFDVELFDTFFGGGKNIGYFQSIAGQDDVKVTDADTNLLLSGNFLSLTMTGNDNAGIGFITAEFVTNGGLLADQFGIGNVVALQFNLGGTAFNSTMFDNNFSGLINGNIKGQNNVAISVAEPNLLALLSIGLLLVGFIGKRSQRS